MEELLNKLAELDISLEARGSELDIYDPRQGLTQELLSVIRENKRQLLALLKDTGAAAPFKPISRVATAEHYALSAAQKRLYFLYEFDRSSIAYNLPKILEIEGRMDVPRLERAFRRLIARHESLRTWFDTVDEMPVQRISGEVPFAIDRFYCRPEEAAGLLRTYIRPFSLESAPLMRVALIGTGQDRYLLVMDTHHIIADGASQDILTRDLMLLYTDALLPALELQFKDYAAWRQGPDQQMATDQQKDFWVEMFRKQTVPLELPADMTRPPVVGYEGDSLDLSLDGEMARRMKQLAGQNGASSFMIYLAVYYIFLSRMSGQEDIVVGIPTAGRHYAGLENVVGMFANTLPIRNLPAGELSFFQFLAQVRSRVLACLDHQDYPYEELIDQQKIERDASRNPLFDVLFDLTHVSPGSARFPGVISRPYRLDHAVAKLDLSLYVLEAESDVTLHFEYSTNLFRRDTVERFAGYFQRIVAAVTEDPEVKLGAIELLPEVEQEELLSGFNDTSREYGREETLVTLFETQAAQRPEEIAVVYEGESLTYGELNRRSNGLAQRLRGEYGVGPDKVVGVMMDRSLELMVGLLGILKAGGAYLPMDPGYPAERTSYILSDSGAEVLIVDRGREGPSGYGGSIVSPRGEEETDDLPRVNGSGDLCYLIYTSGSTGNPKGVMIAHRNVVNFFAGLNERLPAGEDDCLLAVTSTSFDISVLELFWTLCNGIQVVIHPSGISFSGLDR
ncbi:MAG TPA: condensation domain-containing protein, partial [Puia sp.]|nr:condensation domain-containing protein [Puia sp.]